MLMSDPATEQNFDRSLYEALFKAGSVLMAYLRKRLGKPDPNHCPHCGWRMK